MSRFEISIPNGFTGVGAGGVKFANGKAVVSSDTEGGLSALAYFKSQGGYGILPLDETSVDEVLQHGNSAPAEEAETLRREIKALEDRRDLEKLRKERDDLYREVYGVDRDEAEQRNAEQGGLPAGATLTPGAAPATEVDKAQTQGSTPKAPPYVSPETPQDGKLKPPPADNAPVAEWRTWAVESGRAKAEDVEKAPRGEIIAKHGADYDRDREAQLKGEGSDAQ
jgi:hypothetical protein